ncbi:hypothetical protein RRG08_046065 [Elysia crispata]|uniref:Uncharacterized protein n=1 Tax=Elysia crispata TaxID=231223 RepID=A0AAE0XE27_9GAST|nr:hypothetical protein RRG08_046065 [Elysia crispata]
MRKAAGFFHSAEFLKWLRDKAVTIDKVDLCLREEFQPPGEVDMISGDIDWAIIPTTSGSVLKNSRRALVPPFITPMTMSPGIFLEFSFTSNAASLIL